MRYLLTFVNNRNLRLEGQEQLRGPVHIRSPLTETRACTAPRKKTLRQGEREVPRSRSGYGIIENYFIFKKSTGEMVFTGEFLKPFSLSLVIM